MAKVVGMEDMELASLASDELQEMNVIVEAFAFFGLRPFYSAQGPVQ